MSDGTSLINNPSAPKKIKSGRGGYRKGAGRKRGSVSEATKLRKQVEARLKELAAQHTPEAVETLVSIFKSSKTPAAARVAAIKEILDRGHGKAPQAIVGDPNAPIEVRVTRVELVPGHGNSTH